MKTPEKTLTPRQYAVLAARQCTKLTPEGQDLLARILERELQKAKRRKP